jgi:hypothetical protein
MKNLIRNILREGDWDFMDDISEIPSKWDEETLLNILKDYNIIFKYEPQEGYWHDSEYTGMYKYELVGGDILLYTEFVDGFKRDEHGDKRAHNTREIIRKFNEKGNLKWEVIDFEPKDKPLTEDKDWDFMDDIKAIPKNDSWHETTIYFHPIPEPEDWDLVYKTLTDDGYDWGNGGIDINPFSIWRRKVEEEWDGYEVGFLHIGNNNKMSQSVDTISSISGHNYWLRDKMVDGNKVFNL